MSQDIIKKLQKTLYSSEISHEDATDLIDLITTTKDNQIEEFSDLFTKSPKIALEFNDILKAKRMAVLNKDKKLWEETIKREENILKEIESSDVFIL